MTILLTGGTGYIASHTAVELLSKGYSIVLMDNLSHSDGSAVDAIEKITSIRPVFYKLDATKETDLEQIFSENKIDAVIHFAGLKAVPESVEKPLEYYQNNLDSTIELLKVMKKHNCKNILFSSSATVYGGDNPVPFVETQPAGGCTNPYGKTKFFNEEILKDAAAADKDLSVVILRYFNPIGSHESGLLEEQPVGKPLNLFPILCQVADGVLPILNITGNDYDTKDGTGERDYIHVLDLASGHEAALRYAFAHKGAEVFNLGTGKGTSVLELVNAFEKMRGLTLNKQFAPRRPGDIAAAYANVDKANTILNWRATHSIEDACKNNKINRG